MMKQPWHGRVNKTHMKRLARVCADMLMNRTERDWWKIELEVVFLLTAMYPRGIPRGRRIELTETTDRRIVRAKTMLDFLHAKGYSTINSHDIHQTKRIASIRATKAEQRLMRQIVDFTQDEGILGKGTDETIDETD